MSVLLSTVSKTRPANTTQYAVNDVINESASAGSAWTFEGMASQPGRAGTIHKATLVTSAEQATKPQTKLFLFDTEPGADNDNAANTISDSELKTCVGVIEFKAEDFIGTGNSGIITVKTHIDYKCAAGDNRLFGVLVSENNYTPVSGEEITIVLQAETLN